MNGTEVRCSVFVAASLDGFIARPDGDTGWLHRPEYALGDADDFGYQTFIQTVDVLVMGRRTFEQVLGFGAWPYGEMPIVVLSSRRLAIPSALQEKVRVEDRRPEDLVSRLAAVGARHLYIDGGVTIQRFLQAGLIHEVTITWIPVLLGAGIPLFGSPGREIRLELAASQSYGNGFVQTRYRTQVHAE